MPPTPKQLIRVFGPVLGLALLACAGCFLWQKLHTLSLASVWHDMLSLSPLRLCAGVLLTVFYYFLLTGYDFFGLRYAGRRLAYRKVAMAAFVGDSLNANMGLPVIVGSSVKYRFYSQWGVSTIDIVKAIGVYTLSHWLGFCFCTGFALAAGMQSLDRIAPSLSLIGRPIGFILLAAVAAYAVAIAFRRKLDLSRILRFPVPSKGVAYSLLTIACMDWVSSATIFYLFMPQGTGIHYAGFVGLYLIAQVSGIVSQVPGGLAVFESVALAGLSATGGLSSSAIFASLVVFRAIFYLIPFGCAAITMAVFELHQSGSTLHQRFLRRKRTLS